ncbi:fumarate hydratase C-terminal domain-containing protein [uncultured Cocleimonas sp.]|uniref:fumarate hydratase C-terminal domain-containing protein n=1 Tax=uncultured Cocleimonas sp. TaxID=1051587 RepID=UPI002622D0E8|nr:fumarate hydratase C-terminal domain-containing protein [uncultured Cocleimonas sp.]
MTSKANENGEFKEVRLQVPVKQEDLEKLEIGTIVYLDGIIYTGREGVYKRVLEEGYDIPLDLPALSNVNFHCSPAAAIEPDGTYNVGGVTATASFRFAKWMTGWFNKSGAKVIIGKGGMSSEQYKELYVPAGAVYLTTVGYGTGALLGRGIKKVRQVEWFKELGNAQAMWVFEVENFGPFIVDSDLKGNSLFEQEGKKINKKLDKLYEGLKKPALSRYGETDDRSDELI